MDTFCKRQKTYFWPNFGPIQGQKGTKNMAHVGHNLYTTETISDIPANQVSWSHIEQFWESGQKP